MTTTRKTQIGLLSTAAVLFVLLFIAPKTPSAKATESKKAEGAQVTSQNLKTFVEMASKSLEIKDKTLYDDLLQKATSSSVDSLYIPVITFWSEKKRPDFVAYFTEQQALKSQKAEDFLKAGDRYFFSVRFIKDENIIPVLYKSAIRCYETAIEKNPNYTDAKIQLAACLVEGVEGDPMKGIAMLKEIEKTDSNNVKLQMNFAFFSIRSQQWDKAIKRFEKVLELDPLFIEAYLHLADAYEQQGDTEKTILMLEQYIAKSDDATAKAEVKKYIEQLKK